MQLEQEILEIKALIDELRAVDADFRVFGARSHRYRIGPPLPETEIRAFETKHSITLPADYRLYLQLVGNGNGEPWREQTGPWQRGGAGPSYGLYPLTETVNGQRVREPFPFEEKIELPYEPPYDAWEDDIPGAIEINTGGCSSHTHLIVQGPQQGTIWEGFDYDNFIPTGLTFSQWMRNWVEKKIPLARAERVTYGIREGMGVEEVVTICSGDGARPHSIKESFLRFEGLSAYYELDREEGKRVVRVIKSFVC